MVELMVALVVSAIVITGVMAFSSIQRGIASEQARQSKSTRDLDGSMWSLSQDINRAGLGFARSCSELRIWDGARNRLLNPGAIQVASNLDQRVVDPDTGESYWVLRDGIQAHWRSSGSTSLWGSGKKSSSSGSAADSLDIVLGDANFISATGLFELDGATWTSGELQSGKSAALRLKSVESQTGSAASGKLDSSNSGDLAAAQQLFVPGTFVMLMSKGQGDQAFRPHRQSQCVLLQITGSLTQGADGREWKLPISNKSKFNANLKELMGLPGVSTGYQPRKAKPGGTGGTGDWIPGALSQAMVVPLGYLRWSRYEIDYAKKGAPYLVRTDIIGIKEGKKNFSAGGVSYPSCSGNKCPGAQLRIPGKGDKPPRFAIAPMIEDMQVAVGCDGYSQASVDKRNASIADRHDPRVMWGPDSGFDETLHLPVANLRVDEASNLDDRSQDEWLGNADGETWAPDCVYYGTAESYKDRWAQLSSQNGKSTTGGPAFRMSPQVIRVSLVSRLTGKSSASKSDDLIPLEDRVAMTSFVPGYPVQIHTEKFAPNSLRWRDPAVP